MERFPYNTILFCLFAVVLIVLACQEFHDFTPFEKQELTYDESLTDDSQNDLLYARALEYAQTLQGRQTFIINDDNIVKVFSLTDGYLSIHCRDFLTSQDTELIPPDIIDGHPIQATHWTQATVDGQRLFLITSDGSPNERELRNVIYLDARDNSFHYVAHKGGWWFYSENNKKYLRNYDDETNAILSSIPVGKVYSADRTKKTDSYSGKNDSQLDDDMRNATNNQEQISNPKVQTKPQNDELSTIEDSKIYSLSELSLNENPQFPSEGNAGFKHFKLAVIDHVRKQIGSDGDKKIYVEFCVNAQGETYRIDTSLIHDQELRQKVHKIFKSLHFIPAKRNGKPINVSMNISM